MHMYVYTYTYIYIYREREKERDIEPEVIKSFVGMDRRLFGDERLWQLFERFVLWGVPLQELYEEFARLAETRLARSTLKYVKLVLLTLNDINVRGVYSYVKLQSSSSASRSGACRIIYYIIHIYISTYIYIYIYIYMHV